MTVANPVSLGSCPREVSGSGEQAKLQRAIRSAFPPSTRSQLCCSCVEAGCGHSQETGNEVVSMLTNPPFQPSSHLPCRAQLTRHLLQEATCLLYLNSWPAKVLHPWNVSSRHTLSRCFFSFVAQLLPFPMNVRIGTLLFSALWSQNPGDALHILKTSHLTSKQTSGSFQGRKHTFICELHAAVLWVSGQGWHAVRCCVCWTAVRFGLYMHHHLNTCDIQKASLIFQKRLNSHSIHEPRALGSILLGKLHLRKDFSDYWNINK